MYTPASDDYGGDDRRGGWNGGGGYGRGSYNNNDSDRGWGRGGGGMGDRDDAGAQQGELPMANERWQNHAQAVGAGWGDGGGSFYQRRGHVEDQRWVSGVFDTSVCSFLRDCFSWL